MAEIDFSASGAAADATIEAVELSAVADATSMASGVASTEVVLLAGEALAWREVDRAAAGTALTYCGARTDRGGACEIVRDGRFVLGANRTVLLGVAPAGVNGSAVATIALDYAEVKVRYSSR